VLQTLPAVNIGPGGLVFKHRNQLSRNYI